MAARVSEDEVKTVEGVAGAKTGIALATRVGELNPRTIAIPIILGGIAGIFLPGKETEKKVKKAIKLVKEANMDKATFIFNEMIKKAGIAGMATTGLIATSFLPKPRKTAMSFQTNAEGKTVAMKKLINLPKSK